MALLTLAQGQLAYGHWPLLDHADFALEAGERLALIGRNGSGKSSLLKVLAGLERLDDGLLQVQQSLRRIYVAQEPELDAQARVFDAVADGVAEARALRERFEAHAPGDDLDALQTRLEQLGGWTWEQRVQQALQHLSLDGEAVLGQLSGGQRKRVALAQALVAQPDVLLLDEPTNHLDLDGIEWLAALLRDWRGALIVVSHDRAFIDEVATRIVELDRGRLYVGPAPLAAFDAQRERELAAQALAQARADKLLAQEEAWIRQGVEARRTRSVARVERLKRLREARAARRERLGQVRLQVDRGQAGGQLVAELQDVSKSYGERRIVERFSATLLRGDKVGIVGPNGAGKTTLLKLILGQIAPDAGRVRLGTRLEIAYFDQLREALDEDKTLIETVSPGGDWIEIGGSRQHAIGYLGQFLFAPERAQSPVKTLSGGERNRLLLARLFARPANVLVLDEPTNDLDIDTLELLESLLADYAGTVFLVSHDRRFLDNVVTSLIAWEGQRRPGLWREYEGGVEDWLQQRARGAAPAAPAPVVAAASSAADAPSPLAPARSGAGAGADAGADAGAGAGAGAAVSPRRRKLGFKEQRELDELPGRIEALEAEQKALGERLASPGLYREAPNEVAAVKARFDAIEEELMAALERWEALGS